jgi:hypothetical protein
VEKIVASNRGAYPEKLGRWRGFLDQYVVRSLEFKAESYSVDWLG